MAAMTLSACFPDFFPPWPAPLPYDDQADDPMCYESDEEYQALMLAEFGPIVPLLTMDFEAAMKLTVVTGDETQAERSSKKRKKNKDEETQDERSSKKKKSKDDRSNKKRKKDDDEIQAPLSKRKRTKETEEIEAAEFEEEEEEPLPSPRSTNKMIATRLLKRRDIRAPEPSESEADGETHTVLWCECGGLPRGSPGCALHQHVPGRSWMLRQGDVPAVGGNDGVLVPKTSTDSRRLVASYMRWRRSVWMPSRFYLEKSQKERAYQDAEDEMKRLLGASVLPC